MTYIDEFNTMITTMPKIPEFTYWFNYIGDGKYEVRGIKSGGPYGTYQEDSGVADADVLADFSRFKQRPEYLLHQELTEFTPSVYITLLAAIFLEKCNKRGEEIAETAEQRAIAQACRCIEWLVRTDFFSAPASTQYHESYAGGLLHHTFNVYKQMQSLRTLRCFESVDPVSAALVALTHDWCKIGAYESYMRNVKNDAGVWEQVQCYKRSDKGACLGHGTNSAFMISRYLVLSLEEFAAIRWHMGRWYVAESDVNDLQRANEVYPLVLMLQFADQLSITSYAN